MINNDGARRLNPLMEVGEGGSRILRIRPPGMIALDFPKITFLPAGVDDSGYLIDTFADLEVTSLLSACVLRTIGCVQINYL